MSRILPRENPFRSERIDNIAYRLDGMNWDDILLQLEALGYRASIIGPKGSGKSTFIRDLVPKLKQKGFSVQLIKSRAENDRVPLTFCLQFVIRTQPKNIILIDGAEQLGLWRILLFRAFSLLRAGVIVTSHQRCFLPLLLECSTRVDLMDEILTELVDDIDVDTIEIGRHYFHKHNGNIREALRNMYDLYACDRF